MAIHEPEQSVVRLKEFSAVLDRLPGMAELLRRGEVDLRRVEVMNERVVNLGCPELIAQVEEALLEVAPELNRTQLARRTSGLVAQADPEGYERRCQKARAGRRVECTPLPDGMAKLVWILPAAEADRIHQQICADAKRLPKDERTTDQKRCDVLLDRVMGASREWNVRTFVTVSMETLMGLTNDPGQLAGYGPISADAARALAMRGPWRGILLDEYRHAAAISVDTYRPTALLKEFGRVRDGGVCTAPGCNNPIQEFDHVVPWPQGKTVATQVDGKCMWHHHRKHDDYTVTRDSDGTCHWTTPLGREYTTTPVEY